MTAEARDKMVQFVMLRPEKLGQAHSMKRSLAFRYALRQSIHFSETAAAWLLASRRQQHQALLAIKGFPGRDQVTVGELAERLQLLSSQCGWID